MRVAFVHDWLVSYRGGERVLEAMLELYPSAPIFTLFYDPASMPESIRSRDVRTSPWLNRLRPFRKALLPLLPAAIEAFPLEDYDLILSTSSCVAKGVMVGPQSKHLCYIHSPMRYIWDQRQHYLVPSRNFSPREFIIHLLSSRLRIWDVTTNHRVDRFVANSGFVKSRVRRYYDRDASVVHPPVDINRFMNGSAQRAKQGYFLAAGAFVDYKRFDLAIKACERLGRRLLVVGSGPEERNLRKIAGPHTEFVIAPSAERWAEIFQAADALIFPGVEDFGITAIESLAAGTPLIAFKAGGALDFVVEGETGVFFKEATVESLIETIEKFSPAMFSRERLQEFSRGFSKENFLEKIRLEIDSVWGGGL